MNLKTALFTVLIMSVFVCLLCKGTVYAAPAPPDKNPASAPSPAPESPKIGEHTDGPKNDPGMKSAPEVPDPGKDIFDKFERDGSSKESSHD